MEKDVFETLIVFVEPKDDYSLYEFEVELKDWTSTFIKVQLHFIDPQLISRSFELDELWFYIINPDLFTSKEFGTTPSDEIRRVIAPAGIPKLLPLGISEEDIRSAAKNAF